MREGITYHSEEHRDPGLWDPVAIGKTLGVHPEHTSDLFFGDGASYRLGPDKTTQLSIYPEHNAVEVTTPDVVISLRKRSELSLTDEGVVFDAHSPEGSVLLFVEKDGATHLTRIPVTGNEPVQAHQDDPGREDPKRLILFGRVAHEPAFSPDDRGGVIVRFPLAVPEDGNGARVHNVYSSKRFADRIREKDLRRGDPIKVVGVLHRFGDGDERIYAFGVRKTAGGATEPTQDAPQAHNRTRTEDTPTR